jgi:hypothetical protein
MILNAAKAFISSSTKREALQKSSSLGFRMIDRSIHAIYQRRNHGRGARAQIQETQ